MAMIDRIGEDLGFYQKAISLRQQRQEVLAANIANADTPNYKSRDFDFGAALKDAMGEGMRLPDTQLALTSARHIPAKAVSPDPAELLYRQPLQPSMDGNTVDMDVERVQFADNTLRYQSDLTVISGRIKTMMAALQQ
jgi:flagellar basal-body rod protein FlgB